MEHDSPFDPAKEIPGLVLRLLLTERTIEDIAKDNKLKAYWREMNKIVIIKGREMTKNWNYGSCRCGNACFGQFYVPVEPEIYSSSSNVKRGVSEEPHDATLETYEDMPPLEDDIK